VKRALVAAITGLGACLGACTSGGTPDCDGGSCGYTVPETGPEEGGVPDSSVESSAPDASSADSGDAADGGGGSDGPGVSDAADGGVATDGGAG
jgi:hypothetical protein